MKSLFTEKTEKIINGADLKKLISSVADDCMVEEDFEGAAIFYKAALDVDTSSNYRCVQKNEYFELNVDEKASLNVNEEK